VGPPLPLTLALAGQAISLTKLKPLLGRRYLAGVPELPEVETIRAELEPLLAGRMICSSGSHPSEKFVEAPEAIGAEVSDVRRRGKYLIIGLDRRYRAAQSHRTQADRGNGNTGCNSEELVVHLGMTGRLALTRDADLANPHLRAWWKLDDGRTMTFHDIRRFGRIRVVAAGDYSTIPTLHALGPEPFSEDFDAASLWCSLRASSRCIKTQLLSQRPVAGVGNIYADESLWLARINPAARRLSLQRSATLVEALREALSSGLRHGGTTLRDYVSATGTRGANQHHLYCYGRAGEPCERCGSELRRKVIDARSTTFCGRCQQR